MLRNRHALAGACALVMAALAAAISPASAKGTGQSFPIFRSASADEAGAIAVAGIRERMPVHPRFEPMPVHPRLVAGIRERMPVAPKFVA